MNGNQLHAATIVFPSRWIGQVETDFVFDHYQTDLTFKIYFRVEFIAKHVIPNWKKQKDSLECDETRV